MVRLRSISAGALLLLLLALPVVTGCGGGGEEQSTETTVAAVAPVAQPVVDSGTQSRHTYERLVGTQLTPTEETPSVVGDALAQQRPVIVLFFVPGSEDDSLVRASLDELMPEYSDVTLAAFDFKAPDEFGDLARLLQIDYPPQLVFIDTTGVIRSVLSGFVDKGTLNQHIVNIRQG